MVCAGNVSHSLLAGLSSDMLVQAAFVANATFMTADPPVGGPAPRCALGWPLSLSRAALHTLPMVAESRLRIRAFCRDGAIARRATSHLVSCGESCCMPLTMQVHVLRTVVGIPQRCERAVSAQLCRRLQARHHAWQVGAAAESVHAAVGVALDGCDGCNACRTALM